MEPHKDDKPGIGHWLSYIPYLLALVIVIYVFFPRYLPPPLIIVAALLYFVPAVVAVRRHHRQRTAIVVLNILLGWTFIGWVIALVWACTNDVESRATLG